jgi:hypothetical protein
VRNELGDTGITPVWSDTLLNQWLEEGLNQLAADLPKMPQVTLTALPGVKEYSLADFVSLVPWREGAVQSVECPAGRKLPRGEVRERIAGLDDNPTALYGSDNHPRIYENCWEIQLLASTNPALVFRYPPVPVDGPSNQQIVIWAYGNYSGPIPNDSYALDILDFDAQLLVWYVAGRAVSWLAEQRGKRGDMSSARSRPQATYYERLYQNGIKLHQRRRGIRSSVLRD